MNRTIGLQSQLFRKHPHCSPKLVVQSDITTSKYQSSNSVSLLIKGTVNLNLSNSNRHVEFNCHCISFSMMIKNVENLFMSLFSTPRSFFGIVPLQIFVGQRILIYSELKFFITYLTTSSVHSLWLTSSFYQCFSKSSFKFWCSIFLTFKYL